MNRREAINMIIAEWLPVTEKAFKCPVRLDDSLTEEYDWGWVFHIVASDKPLHSDSRLRDRYAIDRITGYSCPIGTKGIEQAIIYIKKHRKDYEDSKRDG